MSTQAQQSYPNWLESFDKKYQDVIRQNWIDPELPIFNYDEYKNLPLIKCDYRENDKDGFFKINIKYKVFSNNPPIPLRVEKERRIVSVDDPYEDTDVFIVYWKHDGKMQQSVIYLSNKLSNRLN